MANEQAEYGNTRITLTDEEQAAREDKRTADATAQAAKDAFAAALASIYAPVEYNGKLYPADPESILKYEVAKQSKGRGKATKGVAIAVDGTPLKLSSPAAIDAFHEVIEDAIVARLATVHDAL